MHTDSDIKCIKIYILFKAVITRTLVAYSNFNALEYSTYKTPHAYTARYLLISRGSNKLSCSRGALNSSGDFPKCGDALASKHQKNLACSAH